MANKSLGMLFIVSILASVMLMSCSYQNVENVQDMTEYDFAESNHSKPEDASSAPINHCLLYTSDAADEL